jgi:uncharacterized integral membrane protein
MRIKTIFLIVATMLLTVIIVNNSEEVEFNIFLWHPRISKLVMMAIIAIVSFLIGLLVGRPKKVKFDDSHPSMDNPTGSKNDTLSNEDREYIG